MNDLSKQFNEILRRSAKERRNLSAEDIRVLTLVDLNEEQWTPGKTGKTMELMQTALREMKQMVL